MRFAMQPIPPTINKASSRFSFCEFLPYNGRHRADFLFLAVLGGLWRIYQWGCERLEQRPLAGVKTSLVIAAIGRLAWPNANIGNKIVKMCSGIKPLTITKRQGKELLPPKLVDR